MKQALHLRAATIPLYAIDIILTKISTYCMSISCVADLMNHKNSLL